jgi:hypothetical protein
MLPRLGSPLSPFGAVAAHIDCRLVLAFAQIDDMA